MLCYLCEKRKPASKDCWDKEHIIDYGFGNDGKTDATLEHKICKHCNERLGDGIGKPFLRHVTSREIQCVHGMKRRKANTELIVSGGGFVVISSQGDFVALPGLMPG